MADPPRYSDTGDDNGVGPDHESPPRMPRWVKVGAIIIGILVVLFVILQLAGIGGDHGPGRHLSGGDARAAVAEEQAPPAGITR